MSRLLEQVLLANIYLQPIQFVLAITVNTINICVLCSRVLRLSPCTHYFLAYAIFSIFYTSLVCPTQFLRGFYIDWAVGDFACKLHSYILFVFPFQGNLMLILASFDRYCSSSQSCRLNSKSTIRMARITIIIGTILCALYMLPMFFIYHWNDVSNKCVQKSNTLIFIYVISQVFLYYILTPVLLLVFGLLTINNIRQQSIRSVPLITTIRGRRTEGQLTRMLLLQVIVHLILVLPFGVVYTMNSFQSSTRTSTIKGIRYVFVIWQQCDYFVSFFLYVLSGNIYRQQLIKILEPFNCHHTSPRSFTRNNTGIYQELPLTETTMKR